MARLLRLGRPRRGLAHAALGAFNDLNVAIDLGLIVAIGPCHHRPRLDRRRPASTTRSTFLGARRDRASFVRDRRDAAGDLDAGYQRIVWICPLPSNEGDVFFSLSHVRAVSSRWGRRLGGFFIACHINHATAPSSAHGRAVVLSTAHLRGDQRGSARRDSS